MQIKITITDEEYEKLKEQATKHLNSLSKEARVIIHKELFTNKTTESAITSQSQPKTIKERLRIWLNTTDTDPMDTSSATFNKAKASISKVLR
ncbi:MAG: hypothetical protein K2P14_10370 [Anaeroplasmataceae bacterium]|nr:hypothetical protein [Anaeroplasmataceae bacterium]